MAWTVQVLPPSLTAEIGKQCSVARDHPAFKAFITHMSMDVGMEDTWQFGEVGADELGDPYEDLKMWREWLAGKDPQHK